ESRRPIETTVQTLGIETRWEVIPGGQDFFSVAKSLYNAMQGREQVIPDDMYQTHLEVNRRNAKTLNLDADLVMVHDLQPAALVEQRPRGRWVWRCHLDLSQPQPRVWSFPRQFVNRYDAAVFSLPAFALLLNIPQYLIYPSM